MTCGYKHIGHCEHGHILMDIQHKHVYSKANRHSTWIQGQFYFFDDKMLMQTFCKLPSQALSLHSFDSLNLPVKPC